VPLSLHGIQVLDPHLGFAFNSCDSFERPVLAGLIQDLVAM